MKLITAATLAVSVVGAAPLSDLVEDLLELKTEQVAKFDVKTLGGMTLRAPQVYNGNFYTQGRGPRAYLQSLRKFSQFGATVDPSLLCIVDTILQELGLSSLAGAAAADCSTATGGSGTGSAASSKPTATGAGTRPSATGRPSTGNATGTGQGMCFSRDPPPVSRTPLRPALLTRKTRYRGGYAGSERCGVPHARANWQSAADGNARFRHGLVGPLGVY